MTTKPISEIQRAQWHDYHAMGCYMITATTEGRRPLLGAIKGASAEEAHVELTPLGRVLEESIRSIPVHFPEVEVKAFVVMPDHFHLQVFVARPMQKHLGAVVGLVKTAATRAYLHELNMSELALHVIPPTGDRYNQERQRARIITAMQANGVAGYEAASLKRPEPSGLVEEVAAIIRRKAELLTGAASAAGLAGGDGLGGAGLGSAEPNRAAPSPNRAATETGAAPSPNRAATATGAAPSVLVRAVAPLFAKGYHDRIVRSKEQREAQVRYIRQNPQRAWMKRHTPLEWRRPKDITLDLPLPRAQHLKAQAQWWDEQRTMTHSRYGTPHHYAETYVELLGKCLRKRRVEEVEKVERVERVKNVEKVKKVERVAGEGAAGGAGEVRYQPYLRMRACGNVDLLGCGRPLVAVRISRRVDEERLRQTLLAILQRCEEEGAIPVSPFISDGEQLLKLMAKYNGYDIIEIHLESMSDLWHPATKNNPRLLEQLKERLSREQAQSQTHPPSLSIPDDESYAFDGRMLILAPWYDRPQSDRPVKPDMELGNLLAKEMGEIEN